MPYRGGRRWFSLASYLMFVGVGVISFISPLPTFTNMVSAVITVSWSVVIVLGGVLGIIGIVQRSPSFEYAGLPLQFTATGVFGVVLIYRAFSGITTSVWGTSVVGMLMMALTFKLLARWFEVGWSVRKFSRRTGR